ncbi:teichoic acid transporter [Actinoplanes sp. NBRC 14428]|nr:teichoic acid transporter [Actinoplanes sp. NBRC 14428]
MSLEAEQKDRERQDVGAPEAAEVPLTRHQVTGTPAAASKRDRTVTFGIATALASKGFGLAAPMVITPICFRYLGSERYGLWMALAALTSMAWFADLGLGNGLLTRLSGMAGDVPQQRREISSAYATLGIVAATLLLLLALGNPSVPWVQLFSVADPKVSTEASGIAALCFGSFFINIPLSLVQRVQYARGQIVQSNTWQSFGALLSLVGVVGAIAAEWTPVMVIACAVLAIPLGNLLNTAFYFWVQQPEARPALKYVHGATARSLLGLGLQFFVITSMSSVALNLDNPLVAHFLGVGTAAHFAVVGKIFGLLALFVGMVSMTLWSVNGQALSQGDVAWVRRNTRRMIVASAAIVGAAGLALVMFSDQFVKIWVGTTDPEVVSPWVLSGLAGWSLLVAVTSPLIMVQNSIGLLKPQFVGWALFLVAATVAKVWGLQHFGLAGLPAAACIVYITTMWPSAFIGYRKALRARERPCSAKSSS